MDLEYLMPIIARQIGIEPTTLLFYAGLIVALSNALARFIPSDATGWKGTVRFIASFIGFNVSNRISGNITTSDVAKLVLHDRGVEVKDGIDTVVGKVANRITEPLETQFEQVIESAKPLFPGVARGQDGKFVSLKRGNESLNESKE